MITVRDATRDDIPALLPQARAFADTFDAKTALWPGDTEAAQFLARFIEEQPVFVAETEDGTLVGFIMGMFAPHYFNQQILTLTELAWWVQPEHRGSRAALLLLQAFSDCGALHAEWTMLSLEESSQLNDRTLAKRGFRRVERSYLKEASV
jgi:L-amino acid N-acyltransferase YncA